MRCKYESWENVRFVLLEDEEVCPTTIRVRGESKLSC